MATSTRHDVPSPSGKAAAFELDPDRLFPADPRTREIARNLHATVREYPIISPHGHVDPRLLADNPSFSDAAELFIRHDHYVTRMLHAAGVSLEELGIAPIGAPAPNVSPRDTWRIFCSHWLDYAGTASGYWLRESLVSQFGIDAAPDAENADVLFERIQRRLDTDAFKPRTLFDTFHIDVLATTDDPMSDLAEHASLAADPGFRGRVIPTFRPDAYLDPGVAGWKDRVQRLATWAGTPVSSYTGFVDALAARRRYFIAHGAVSADHGVREPVAIALAADDAARLFERALHAGLTADERRVFGAHMLLEMARMSVDDGLVMTIHPGVLRNHDGPTAARFGPDMGNDIPLRTEYAMGLRPLLERHGNDESFHLVLFSVDETSYSRDIAPLAGYYPSVYIGAPWWFLDAPDATLRFRAAVTETAGFYRSAGFVDDTRAFLSIPARHDMARRLDAAFLARLVCEGRLGERDAQRIIVDLVDTQPRKVFKL